MMVAEPAQPAGRGLRLKRVISRPTAPMPTTIKSARINGQSAIEGSARCANVSGIHKADATTTAAQHELMTPNPSGDIPISIQVLYYVIGTEAVRIRRAHARSEVARRASLHSWTGVQSCTKRAVFRATARRRCTQTTGPRQRRQGERHPLRVDTVAPKTVQRSCY